jgi:hypothetical protein
MELCQPQEYYEYMEVLSFVYRPFTPRKLARVVTFLTCIQQVPGSNIGRDPDYPE